MYDIKTIKKTLRLLKKYDYQFAKTSKQTGIKVRTLRSRYNKEKRGEPLLIKPFLFKKRGKWNEDEMKKVKDHYFSHGESITKTIKKLDIQNLLL